MEDDKPPDASAGFRMGSRPVRAHFPPFLPFYIWDLPMTWDFLSIFSGFECNGRLKKDDTVQLSWKCHLHCDQLKLAASAASTVENETSPARPEACCGKILDFFFCNLMDIFDQVPVDKNAT